MRTILPSIVYCLFSVLAAAQSPGDLLYNTKNAGAGSTLRSLTPSTSTDLLSFNGSGLLTRVPQSTFAAASHTQAISTITGLQDALDAKLATATAITTYQPLDTDLSAIAALTTTSYGRGLLTTADAATLRSANGLNSASNITTGSLALARLAGGGAAEGNLLVWDSFGTTWQPRTLAQIIGPGVVTTALNVASTDNSYPQISFGSAIGGTASIIVDNLTANRVHNLPDADGTYALTSNIDGTLANNSVTNAMLAGSISLSKLAQSAATSGQVIAWNGTAWAPATASSGLPLSGGTLTGALNFSGTTHAGLQLNNLTTTQRDALSGTAAGRVLWNTSTSRLNVHDGTAWTAGFTRLAGDTMTGPLNINASADGTIFRSQISASDRLTLVTTSTAANLTWGHPSYFQWETSAGSLIVKYAGTERCRFTMAENVDNITLRSGGTTGGVYISNSNYSNSFLRGDIRLNSTVGTFTVEPLPRDGIGGYTGAGHTMLVKGGNGQSSSTGAAGGALQLRGGNAGGSGNNNGGDVTITTGTATGSGTKGRMYLDYDALPTSDPVVKGQLWRSGTALQISAGP